MFYPGHLSLHLLFSTPCFRGLEAGGKDLPAFRLPFFLGRRKPGRGSQPGPLGTGMPSGRNVEPRPGEEGRAEAGRRRKFFPRPPARAAPAAPSRLVAWRSGSPGRIPPPGPRGTPRTRRHLPDRPGARDPGHPPRRREGGEGEGHARSAPACSAPGARSPRRPSAGEGTPERPPRDPCPTSGAARDGRAGPPPGARSAPRSGRAARPAASVRPGRGGLGRDPGPARDTPRPRRRARAWASPPPRAGGGAAAAPGERPDRQLCDRLEGAGRPAGCRPAPRDPRPAAGPSAG